MTKEISPVDGAFSSLAINLRHPENSKVALLKTAEKKWQLVELSAKEHHPGETFIQGEALIDLMRSIGDISNYKKLPDLSQIDLQEIQENESFRSLCEQVFPSTTEAVPKKVNIWDKWLNTLVNSAAELDEEALLNEIWQESSNSHPSFDTWKEELRLEWKNQNSDLAFANWLSAKQWQAIGIKAWAKEQKVTTYDEKSFLKWQAAQIDPELHQPTWYLKACSGQKDEKKFNEWRQMIKEGVLKSYEKFKRQTSVSKLTFAEYMRLDFEHLMSGSPLKFHDWLRRRFEN